MKCALLIDAQRTGAWLTSCIIAQTSYRRDSARLPVIKLTK